MEIIVKKKPYEVVETVKDNHYVVKRKKKTYFCIDYGLDEATYDGIIEIEKKMSNTGIIYPHIRVNDKKAHIILTDYIPGPSCLDDLVAGDLTDEHYDGIFMEAWYARNEKYLLDFNPENFKLYNGEVYYMKYKLYPYKEEEAFQLKGIYKWAYTKEFTKHLNELHITVDPSRLKEEFEQNKEIVLLVVKYYR
ncbi:MAG: hypothetical protein LUC16_03005 [Coprobacillus sp.]|nr:hypothetical protein [Coprobacillus sp.]